MNILTQNMDDVKHGVKLIKGGLDWAGFIEGEQVTPQCFSYDEALSWWAEALRERAACLPQATNDDDDIPFDGEYPSYKYTPPVSQWADDEIPF